MKKKNNHPRGARLSTPWSVTPFLLGGALFLTVCLCGPSSIKSTATILFILTLGAAFFRFSTLRDRLSPPVLMLALVTILGGTSALYAVSGKFVLSESLKLLTALCITLLLLAIARKEDPGRRVACVLETCSALTALVSIDLISTRWLSGLVQAVLGWFTEDYAQLGGVEAGVRITSLFANPNIFAGMVGLGVLLSLGLASSAQPGVERKTHLVLLYINALAFVLAFSMGASGSIAVAFLVCLILERSQRRSSLLVSMLETLLLILPSAALISLTSFQAWDGFQPIPLLCAILGSVCLCLADQFVGARIASKLKGKWTVVGIAAILALLVAFALAAYNFTSDISLSSGEGLRRAIYPEPGNYTLVAEEAQVQVSVESQNQQDTMMHTSSILYDGPLNGAAFTVPEDSMVVYFNFSAQEDAHLESVICQGQKAYSIPLRYPLLPGFIANRLQGLFANENAIQRLVFFSDGLKLFRRSPVIGLGLGAFENGIRSVQSFDYATKYAHNHYIQTMVDTGIVGLVCFVSLLVVSAVTVLLARKKCSSQEDSADELCHPLTPFLGGCVVFMAIHAATEVVFSTYSYLPMAFGAFAVVGLCCGDAFSPKWLSKKVKTICLAVICAALLIFGVQLVRNTMARSSIAQGATMETLVDAAKMDPYEWADYMLAYVNNSTTGDTIDQATLEQADAFAQRLSKVNSNTIPIYLAEYYFRTGRPEEGLAMVEKYVTYVSSSSLSWQNAFHLMEQYNDGTDLFREGILHIAQLLDTWQQNNIGVITLDEQSQAFLAQFGG